MRSIRELFEDTTLVEKIKMKLPKFFQIVESENKRGGKTGMEVGTAREKIIIALLIHKFGEENVITEIPTTEAEVDVKLFDNAISIKTITSDQKTPKGVKLKWTANRDAAIKFRDSYKPSCDMLITHIWWANIGGLYYIPLETQLNVWQSVGRIAYMNDPKPNTNPRGIEIMPEVMQKLIEDQRTMRMSILWKSETVNYNPYGRWLELWKED